MKKKRGFTLKSGNDIIGKGSKPSKFKMMGASPIRQDDEAIKQEKFTSAIDQISNNPNLTDDEIRQIVVNQRRGEGGRATSRGVNLSYREALSLRNKAREKQPKEAPAPKTPTVESPPTTIGELRQNLYHEGQVPGYFEGIADPQEDPVRREAMKRELKEETQLELPHEPKFLYKVERPIEKGGNFMYVFHYLSDNELTPTLDHEHTDFGYYQKDEMPEDIYYLRKYLK